MKPLSQKAQCLWAKKSDDSLWLPLWLHLMDTAKAAQKLWDCWLSDGIKTELDKGVKEGSAEQLYVFLAAAHDIGKATPVFQAKRANNIANDIDERIEEKLTLAGLLIRPVPVFLYDKTPHALATQLLLKYAGCNENAAVILGAHHGKPQNNLTQRECGIGVYPENYYLNKGCRESWASVQREMIDFALSLAGIPSMEQVPEPGMTAQVLLSALVIMADWLASNKAYFPYIRLEDEPDLEYSNTRIQYAWEKMHFTCSWYAANDWMNTDLYQKRFDFTANTFQTVVAETAKKTDAPGIFVLEAPMGAGKTEAALAAAEILAYKTKRTGVFFALPTQATSDGIFHRILKWIQKLDTNNQHTIKLAHGKAQFNDNYQALPRFEGSMNVGEDEDGAVVHGWFEGHKKSLLADFVVGTIDQLLLAALRQKHVMLRHLGLANKVVIIDECHAYDAYMSRYLGRALRWLGAYHVPVIVLSATLPADKRKMVIDAYLGKKSTQKLLSDPLGRCTVKPAVTPKWIECRDYPLITYTDGSAVESSAIHADGDLKDVRLESLPESSLADKLDNLLSGGGCAGVLVNTVGRAQKLARLLRERFGNETVCLLHSRFLAPDRAKKEKELLDEIGNTEKGRKLRPKRIVVGTQVLEQSLDIDFDVLVTDICPMDLLLQRIGRLHRHKRNRPEKLCTALCLIIGWDGDEFEEGAKAVYGEYLLMRTRALLPERLTLPRDIPALVQGVYLRNTDPSPEPAGYREAKEKWEKLIADKEKRADDFRICPPYAGIKENITGWLDTDIPVSDRRGEAAVRDSDESIEVLLIQEKKDGVMCFLPWEENGCEIPQGKVPEDELARKLARQRVRLPAALCHNIGRTIDELEELNRQRLAKWQGSPWLDGELFLILDDNFSAKLGGYLITYDQYDGLYFQKEGKADG